MAPVKEVIGLTTPVGIVSWAQGEINPLRHDPRRNAAVNA
jgi:hypothetical protein